MLLAKLQHSQYQQIRFGTCISCYLGPSARQEMLAQLCAQLCQHFLCTRNARVTVAVGKVQSPALFLMHIASYSSKFKKTLSYTEQLVAGNKLLCCWQSYHVTYSKQQVSTSCHKKVVSLIVARDFKGNLGDLIMHYSICVHIIAIFIYL